MEQTITLSGHDFTIGQRHDDAARHHEPPTG